VPAVLGWFLSRAEEYETTERDVHQRFPFARSMRVRCGLPLCPVPDVMIEQLADVVCQEAQRLGLVALRRRPLWPDGKRYACVLTYDIDHIGAPWYWWFIRRLGGGLRQLARLRPKDILLRWSELPAALLIGLGLKSPLMAMEGIRKLTEAHGFRATFFVMSLSSWTAEEGPNKAMHYTTDIPGMGDLLRSYHQRGHEIGLHGSYGAAVSAPLLQEERARLERLIGLPVKAHRHHFLRTRVPESLRAYEATGFECDMSLGWGTSASIRPGTLLPFVPYDRLADRPLKFYELGIHLMDQGNISLEQHLELFEELRAAARQTGGALVLLYHPSILRVFNTREIGCAFKEILKRLKADPEVWVAPACEVLAQWKMSVAPIAGTPEVSDMPEGALMPEI
jgi:hypothetical protein